MINDTATSATTRLCHVLWQSFKDCARTLSLLFQKESMRIFCKKALEEIRLKFIVELLILCQPSILACVTEIKVNFFFFFISGSLVFIFGTQAHRAFVL